MAVVRVHVTKIDGHRALTYQYDVNEYVGFRFHLLCEVGEPWQAEAKAKAEALASRLGCVIRPVMLACRPWYIDTLVKKETP